MDDTVREQPALRVAGYAALIERYRLDVIPNWHRSLVAGSGMHRSDSRENMVEEIYPSRYWPGDESGDHLEFALKYDGTNLAILATLFDAMPPEQLTAYIQSKPVGKLRAAVWFLYVVSDRQCASARGFGAWKNYRYDLLDPKRHYSGHSGTHRPPPTHQRKSAGQ